MVLTPLEGEVRLQLSMGHKERAIQLLDAPSFGPTPEAVDPPDAQRLLACEEALAGGYPTQALMGVRDLLAQGSPAAFLWWSCKSLEGRALLDLGYLDEALQWMDPAILRTRRNQFWWYDALTTLAWIHHFRGERREVRRAVVPRLLLCPLPGFGPWFVGQGSYLLGLTTADPSIRRQHLEAAQENFERADHFAVYASPWKAENLYFGALAAYEAAGRTDPAPLARAHLIFAGPDWDHPVFAPVREALTIQLAFAHGGSVPEPTGLVPRRLLANLELEFSELPER